MDPRYREPTYEVQCGDNGEGLGENVRGDRRKKVRVQNTYSLDIMDLKKQ